MSEPTRDVLECVAALLDQGRTVDRLSRPVTAAALVVVLIGPLITKETPSIVIVSTLLVALAGFAEAYFAIRVGFDAALFHRLAAASQASDFAGIDAALTSLGLLTPAQRGRPADARFAGATRLLRFQVLAFAAQALSVIAGSGMAWMRP